MILVENLPFSRKILAKSLKSAGIAPKEANQLALEIRKDMDKKQIYSISREGLRQLVLDYLEKRYDPSIVDRYLFWSEMRRKQTPKIILIGGSTGSGKSTVAMEIAHRLDITRVVSTDIIRSIMRSILTNTLTPLLHQSSYNAWEKLNTSTPKTEDKVILAFREQALKVAVGIHATIERALLENINLIIEGVHVVPGIIKEKYLRHDRIITFVLITEDEVMHRKRFTYRGETNSQRPTNRYLENFDSIRKIQQYVVSAAQDAKIPVLNNIQLDKTVISSIQYITKKMRDYEKKNESNSTN